MQSNYISPFDDDSYQFLVLTNDRSQQSLWPVFAPVPAGWKTLFGPDEREQCIAFVEQQKV